MSEFPIGKNSQALSDQAPVAGREAKAVQVRGPGYLVDEAPMLVGEQAGDDCLRHVISDTLCSTR